MKLVLLPLNKSSFIEVVNLITILKVIGIPILVYFSLSLFKFEDLTQKYSTKYYSVFFYFVAFLFGIAHINGNLTIITILDILPQLFAGLIFGYIRVSYGIIAVIAIHMANNFIMILPKVIDKIM